jgi:hypothetical protein
LCIQAAHETSEVSIERGQPISKLDDVEPTLAALDFADQPLASAESIGKVSLTQAAGGSKTSQHCEKNFVVTAVEDLGHGYLFRQH